MQPCVYPPWAGLDALSHTFTRDREFCDALAKSHQTQIARLLVYCRWSQKFLPVIQRQLNGLAPRHFASDHLRDAEFWTAALTAGISRDLALIPYLVVRGLMWESGVAVRRGLENVGLLAHLWLDPTKAQFLTKPDGKDFRNAFLNETDKAAAKILCERGVQKRFAVCGMDVSLSRLYRLVSAYSVHGASPNQLVAAETATTKLSCMFVDRPDPVASSLESDLEIFTDACEMLCSETARVFGIAARQYSTPWTVAHDGGELLAKLMDRSSFVMRTHVAETLRDLGWHTHGHS